MTLADFLAKYRHPLSLAVALASSSLVMSLDIETKMIGRFFSSAITTAVYPVQRSLTSLNHATANSVALLLTARDAREQNNDLVRRLATYRVEMEELRSENQRLKGLLEFKESVSLRTMPAQVIGQDADNWYWTVTINKGSADGIKPNLCVVSDRGVVGQVWRVNPFSSQVILIWDSRCKLGALVQRTRAQGIVQGNDDKECYMLYLDTDADVSPGDIVVTSGSGGVYPKGLEVGAVTEVTTEVELPFKRAKIRPSSASAPLEEVLILLPSEMEAPAQ